MERAAKDFTDAQKQDYERLPIPLCILHASADAYRLLVISDGLCALLGRKRETIAPRGAALLDLIAPEDRDIARAAAEYARMSPKAESRAVYRLRCAGGEVRVTSSGMAERQSDGSFLLYIYFSGLPGKDGGAIGMAVPQRAASSISSEPALLRQNSDYYRIASWHSDLTDNRTLAYEPIQERALPLDTSLTYDEAAAWVGATPHLAQDRQALTALLDRTALLRSYGDGRTTFALQYQRDEDGQMPFWVSITIRTFQSAASGHVECVVNVFDVTEKILEAQLISRFTMMGYEVVGILGVSSRKVRYFRLKPMHFGMLFEHYEDYFESIEGDLGRVIAPDQRAAVREALRLETILDALSKESSYDFSFEITTSDGRHRHKLLQFSYLDESRDTIFLCKSDTTSQYRREHAQIGQLRAAKLEADRANAAKSVFLSSMSHDLRTPLNGIIGFTDLALGEADPARKQEYLHKVRSSSTLLLDLVNDTLELSRIESGKSALCPEAANLREMSQAVLTALEPSAAIKSLRFETDLSRCPEVIVWTDRLKFQKIFLNLLSNAIKYTPSGGTVRAEISWEEEPADGFSCHMTVRDTGIGIRPEFLPHIFESFSQDRRPETQNILGTGLGLAIVKHTVTQLGGTVAVESVLQEGSVFRVALPLPRAKADQQRQAKPDLPARSLAGRAVLLCEDNPLNTEIARTLLQNEGLSVECAANGRLGAEAFQASQPGHFFAVLMDLRMPEMDGYEAARTIRALPRPDAATVPIIAMTADAFEADIRNCYAAGMNGHVVKPIDPDHLFRILHEQLDAPR
ncbi:MAG: ATP-binding protein [Oscillospiraceae bacterium]|nr:ATP-binding protein [Oscillospiraceae bacterium]